jgi:hypothetical protein
MDLQSGVKLCDRISRLVKELAEQGDCEVVREFETAGFG